MPVIVLIVLLISFIPTIVALWTGRGPWMHVTWVLSTITTLVFFLWPSSRTFFLVPPVGAVSGELGIVLGGGVACDAIENQSKLKASK